MKINIIIINTCLSTCRDGGELQISRTLLVYISHRIKLSFQKQALPAPPTGFKLTRWVSGHQFLQVVLNFGSCYLQSVSPGSAPTTPTVSRSSTACVTTRIMERAHSLEPAGLGSNPASLLTAWEVLNNLFWFYYSAK